MRLNWKPSHVFYGWWIVGASFLIALYVGGVVFYGFTTIFEPIAHELGWSYTQISFAASLRGLEMGLIAPFVGILVDRWGPRRLIFSGAVVTAAGLILLSRTTSLGMFYGAFALIAIGMSCCTMTGFGLLCFGYASTAGTWLLIPFLILFGIGYGGCSAIRPSLAMEYFGRTNFGTVLGLIIGVNTLGGIISPPLAGWVYDNWGSYHGIWFAFAGLPVAALISIITLPNTNNSNRKRSSQTIY